MITLTDEQKSAVTMVKENNVSILTGGPGTGKTTTINEVLFWAESEKLKIYCCAPSGKAAKRMSESTGRVSSTIHSLLGAFMDEDGFKFSFDSYNQLNCELLIIDECSMVDNSLMDSLLASVPIGSKVLLVGDQDQLPSVGAGAVLRDILRSGRVPHVNLIKIHRNSGDIVKACHNIKEGKFYIPSATLDVENGLNIRHIEVKNDLKIVSTIKDLIVDRMPKRGYDPIWGVQVLSPTNEKTTMSCKSINEVLQRHLNTNDAIEKTIFRVNDKVINTRNQSIGETYICNGDMGEIESITDKVITVKFFNPDRKVDIKKVFNDLKLAYCITCHRFQGSEAPVIIIPVHSSFSFLMNRAWIYTAISRAKEICITVGQFSAIKRAIDKEESGKRVTRLKERLSA